jgi:hypothetical protein
MLLLLLLVLLLWLVQLPTLPSPAARSIAAHHHKDVVRHLSILVLVQPASTSPEPCSRQK